MTTAANLYQRMGIARLQELAATEGEHQDEAARAYVARLADMELERRLWMRHNRPGWHPSSPGFGDGTGKSTVRADPLAEEYDRGNIVDSYWHNRAERSLGKLPERRLAALMIQTAKADHRTRGPLSAKYDEIAAHLGMVLQYLGWPAVDPLPPTVTVEWQEDDSGKRVRVETKTPAFRNGQAIKRAAWEARMELVLQAKVGVV